MAWSRTAHRRSAVMPLIRAALRRFLSTESSGFPKLRNLPYRLRRAAVPAARTAVSDYLISTRCLPSSHADSITALAPCSLHTFLAGIPAVPIPPDHISARLVALEESLRPLPRAAIIAACLSFPSLIENDLCSSAPLVDDLMRAYGGLGPDLGATNDIDVFLRVCGRMQMFYNAGVKIGSIGGLVGCNQRVFLELKEERIGERLKFFKRLGLAGEEAGSFLLSNPGFLDLDFDDVVISVPEYLRRVGLADDEVDVAVKKHPYVVGRNRLENLPGVLRAMGLSHRFLEKISGGGESLRYLSPDFVLEDASYDMEVERAFSDRMVKVKVEMNAQHVDTKLEFLKSIGYGENKKTAHILPVLHSTREMLNERFDYLLERGVEYKMLCRIVSVFPKVLNQGKEMLNEKLNYMTLDLGYSLEYLDCFPALLCFDLENRVKPRAGCTKDCHLQLWHAFPQKFFQVDDIFRANHSAMVSSLVTQWLITAENMSTLDQDTPIQKAIVEELSHTDHHDWNKNFLWCKDSSGGINMYLAAEQKTSDVRQKEEDIPELRLQVEHYKSLLSECEVKMKSKEELQKKTSCRFMLFTVVFSQDFDHKAVAANRYLTHGLPISSKNTYHLLIGQPNHDINARLIWATRVPIKE
uniref:mTERF domain-containing protein 1, mitochondrial n=1 Tax=Aegilops tauschii TaxID=37682 RepID=N1QWT0_AEGTA